MRPAFRLLRPAVLLCVALLPAALTAAAQDQQPTLSPQQLFETGQSEQALQAINEQRERGGAGPADTFLAAQILVKAEQNENARQEFERLAGEDNPEWRLIADSALALLGGDSQRALQVATKSVEAAPEQFYAHYQLGLVKARLEDWAGAAEAFDRATQLNAGFAYAHYYAGLAYSRIKRTDRTAEHFERFLKLAPKAPERPAVETLVRTLRGR